MKLLLVDLPHLCWRHAYANRNLRFGDKPVGVLYGVFKSLISFKREYPLTHLLTCIDAGSLRRERESEQGVKEGIIPTAYKANRHSDEEHDEIRKEVYVQMTELEDILQHTTVQVARVKGYEADDLIASYVMQTYCPCVIITSDHDYFQLLEPGVVIDDQLHHKKYTLESFRDEYQLHAPQQWIDAKALMGDAGDNIHGVPGIGEKTAAKLIRQFGTYQNVIAYCKAIEPSKRKRTEQSIVDNQARIDLAFSLSRMDDDVCIPYPQPRTGDGDLLLDFFKSLSFESLYNSVELLI